MKTNTYDKLATLKRDVDEMKLQEEIRLIGEYEKIEQMPQKERIDARIALAKKYRFSTIGGLLNAVYRAKEHLKK